MNAAPFPEAFESQLARCLLGSLFGSFIDFAAFFVQSQNSFMPSVPTGKIRHFWRVVVILLLAVVFIVPAAIMSEKSPTFDEVSHLPAGYSYLIERAIRHNPQHPPVVKEFLFRQNAQRIIFWGRFFALLLSLGMALVVLLWATHLWGWAGGLLGLFLYA